MLKKIVGMVAALTIVAMITAEQCIARYPVTIEVAYGVNFKPGSEGIPDTTDNQAYVSLGYNFKSGQGTAGIGFKHKALTDDLDRVFLFGKYYLREQDDANPGLRYYARLNIGYTSTPIRDESKLNLEPIMGFEVPVTQKLGVFTEGAFTTNFSQVSEYALRGGASIKLGKADISK